ncbi:MAG: biopolymer transporter ExbD [Calditrichia bacterium]
MAYKPSLRRTRKLEPMNLDIRPVMNLMVVLIPLLLAGSVWTKLAIKELNLPPKSAGFENLDTEKPTEQQARLGLNIIVAQNGFYIGTKSGFLQSDTASAPGSGEPSIPLTSSGAYNYEALHSRLVEIKKKLQDKEFSDRQAILLTAEANVAYKHIIKTMDNVALYFNDDGEAQELFPQIIIGQVVM